MKKTLLAAAAALALVAAPVAYADNAYKIVVDGHDITGTPPLSTVDCTHEPSGVYQAEVSGTKHSSGGLVLIFADRSRPTYVNISQSPGTGHWAWAEVGYPGTASLTVSGNTYKVTGNIGPAKYGSGGPTPVPGSLVPFEFDVTCS